MPAAKPNQVVQFGEAEMFARLVELKKKRDAMKEVYQEMDFLSVQLFGKPLPSVRIAGEEFLCEVKDNFAATNTAYRPAAVSRYEFTMTKVKPGKGEK